jgi:hypothetical protein
MMFTNFWRCLRAAQSVGNFASAYIIRKTEMLVEENWIPIVRVAGVLRTRRVLSGDELNELFR